MYLPVVASKAQLVELVLDIGFLPFFKCGIEGYSLEELCPPELWFTSQPGPWEWKEAAVGAEGLVYGKLFQGKAVFAAPERFAALANYRRDGYDFDTRFELGMCSRREERIVSALADGPLLTHALKRAAGFGGAGGLKGFDATLAELQRQTYVIVDGFEYKLDRFGRRYGWGVSRWTLPESALGAERVRALYIEEPARSLERVADCISRACPGAPREAVLRLIG